MKLDPGSVDLKTVCLAEFDGLYPDRRLDRIGKPGPIKNLRAHLIEIRVIGMPQLGIGNSKGLSEGIICTGINTLRGRQRLNLRPSGG